MKTRKIQAWLLLVLMVIQAFLQPLTVMAMPNHEVIPMRFASQNRGLELPNTLAKVSVAPSEISAKKLLLRKEQSKQHLSVTKPLLKTTQLREAKAPDHGGPSTPEVQGFKSAGDQQLVNLFTGDFQYNIPLLDVGGYPVNLAYNAGIGLNDEASWVGLGWNLNPGSVSRTVRGLPDDFSGDRLERKFNIRPNETTTVTTRFGMQIYGFEAAEMTGSLGISHNNYKGWSLSHSQGMKLKAATKTGNKKLGATLGMELGVEMGVDSRSGGFVGGDVGLSAEDEGVSGSLGIGSKVSTREGLEEISYGAKAKLSVLQAKAEGAVQFISPSYTPRLEMPLVNKSANFHATIGGEVFGLHFNATFQGANTVQRLRHTQLHTRGYGFLYSHKATLNDQLDFTREKDGPYQKEVPNMHLTAMTPDLYSVSADGINEMFKPFRGDVGMVYDPAQYNTSEGVTLGGEIGGGNTVHGGVDISKLDSRAETKKWREDNALEGVIRFQDTMPARPLYEPVYFKSLGEITAMADPTLLQRFGGASAATAVRLHEPDIVNFGRATNNLSNGTTLTTTDQTLLAERTPRVSHFAWRTGTEMYQKGANWADLRVFVQSYGSTKARSGSRGNHISEIEVTAPSGVQYLYSVPAYNHFIRQVSFNIGAIASGGDNSIKNTRGENHFYNTENTPAHAYAWLLSSVLSPDYNDISNDGPSADDFGNYTKFNYNLVHDHFQWRTPHNTNKATFDERYHSDPDDNQGHYTHGSKEIYQLHTIETRNYIAVFETSDREDAKGVSTENGNPNPLQKLKKLDRIKLYTMQEYQSAGTAAVPLKTVHFEYDYSLCPGSPGSDVAVGGGKLTLRRIWFTYQNSMTEAASPYVFNYGNNPAFAATANDRWSTYRPDNGGAFDNERFPFVNQNDRAGVDTLVASWSLNSIQLPTGGYLRVEYESDDYAHVQDKPAMEMVKVRGFSNSPADAPSPNMGNILHFDLPAGVTYGTHSQLSSAVYMQGEMYFNMKVQMKPGVFEYVEGFTQLYPAPTSGTTNFGFSDRGGQHAWVRLTNARDNRNPVRKAAYNLIRSELPEIEDDATFSGHDFLSVLPNFMTKLGASFQNGIENHYDSRGFCASIDPAGGSYIRVQHVPKRKLGGGLRVKAIRTGDNWANMHATPDPTLGTEYVQRYHYTTIDPATNDTISSGVAEYEPLLGNAENPFVRPIHYAEERTWAAWINKHQLEPFGETFMPAASVGYSKVTTEIVDEAGLNTSGYTVNEYFTARDFPVRIERTALQGLHREVLIPVVVYTKRLNAAVISQGFMVETNNMHGKMKSTRTFDANGVAINGADYQYKTAAIGRLDNEVPTVIGTDLTVRNRTLGLFYDITLDARQYVNQLGDYGVGLNLEGMQFGPVPVYIPIPVPDITEGKSEYRGIVLTKAIHRNGILERVTAFENGASLATENRLWDAQTGQTIVSATEDAFSSWTHTTNLPAYWAFPRMGLASTNAGLSLGIVTVQNGRVDVAGAEQKFAEGDEIWLIPPSAPTSMIIQPVYAHVYRLETNNVILIGLNGASVPNGDYRLKLMRSGYRNMPFASVGTFVSQQDTLVRLGEPLNLAPERMLASSAQTFTDFWQTDIVVQPTEERRTCNCTSNLDSDTPARQLARLVEYLVYSPTNLAVSTEEQVRPGGVRYRIESNSGNTLRGTFRTSETATPCGFTMTSVRNISLGQLSGIQAKCGTAVPYNQDGICDAVNTVSLGCVILSSDCVNFFNCTERVTRVSPTCTDAEVVANPYLNNLLGRWRPESSYAIVTARTADIHVRQSGFLEPYTPFWAWNATTRRLQATSDPIWKRAEIITTYNAFGQPLETRDALNRPSSTYYGHGHTMPEASAVNARYSDIGFDGFEEYHYYKHRYIDVSSRSCMLSGHFMFKEPEEFLHAGEARSARLSFISDTAHTGNYALRVLAGAPVEITKTIADATTGRGTRSSRVTGTNFRVRTSDRIKPFEPSSGTYVVSAWVHEDDPRFEKDTFRNAALEVRVAGRTTRFTAGGPIIDGWQQVSGEFIINATDRGQIVIRMLSNGGAVLFDDIRVHPFEAGMASHSYDDRTLRLMASHDAQNFSQIYEYDAEGKLARQKRETERGIVTLKEVRDGKVRLR
jgi:hypothetical protein